MTLSKELLQVIKEQGYNPEDYNRYQLRELIRGFEGGLDISQYNDPERYNQRHMGLIRASLEHGVDITQFNNLEKYDEYQMEQLRLGLEHGIDITSYSNPEYDWEKMEGIRTFLEDYPEFKLVSKEED